MNPKSALLELTGVKGYAIQEAGRLLIATNLNGFSGERIAAATEPVANIFAEIGSQLGIGTARTTTVKGCSNSWVLGFNARRTIAVELEPVTPTATIETHIQNEDWSSFAQKSPKPAAAAAPSPVRHERERSRAVQPTGGTHASVSIARPQQEPPPPARVVPPLPAPRLPKDKASPAVSSDSSQSPFAASAVAKVTPTHDTPVAESRAVLPSPPDLSPRTLPPDGIAASAVTGTTVSPPDPVKTEAPFPGNVPPPPPARPTRTTAAATASPSPNPFLPNARALRRALVRGDLNEAKSIAEDLKNATPPNHDLCGAGTSASALEPLSEAVATILAGNPASAIGPLQSLAVDATLGPSLQWLALVWLTRANIAATRKLDTALSCAQKAAHLSRDLDAESRVVSARLVAEACLYRKSLDQAARFAEQARKLAESLADRDESSEILVLQARIHLANGELDQASSIAERAHALRADWLPAIALLCHCAFANSDVNRVTALLRRFDGLGELPRDIVRISALCTAVTDRRLPSNVAAEFLDLLEQPPASSIIERLGELAHLYPDCEYLSDAFGWKLLKTGRIEPATAVFGTLSRRELLTDDVRASVMLALGYLEAIRGSHHSSGAKIRASVDAAPKHMRIDRSPSTSSGKMRAATPVEVASIEPLSTATPLTGLGRSDGATNSPPTFTGDLSHFCLPDVLEFLRAGQSTGTLLCSSVRGVGALHITKGFITGAAAPKTLPLRELLVRQGSLSPGHAEQAAKLQTDGSTVVSIGVLLVEQGWCTKEAVVQCLRIQIKHTVAALMKWGDGQFVFDPETATQKEVREIEVTVDPQALMMEIFQDGDGDEFLEQPDEAN